MKNIIAYCILALICVSMDAFFAPVFSGPGCDGSSGSSTTSTSSTTADTSNTSVSAQPISTGANELARQTTTQPAGVAGSALIDMTQVVTQGQGEIVSACPLPDKVSNFPGGSEVKKDNDGDGQYDTNETTLGNGTKITQTTDKNGVTTTKKVYPDGRTSTEIDDGKSSRTETTHPNGKKEVVTYDTDESGKTGRREENTYPDGTKEVITGGGMLDPKEHRETTFPDGRKTVTDSEIGGESTSVTTWPDGTKETTVRVAPPDHIVRKEKISPDGTKEKSTSYSDGWSSESETTYPDGGKETSKRVGHEKTTVYQAPDGSKVVMHKDIEEKTITTYDPAGNKTSEHKEKVPLKIPHY